MSAQEAAIVQVVLEGVPLPAEKTELIEYARKQRADWQVLSALERIDDREYKLLDEVGEQLAPVQPAFGSSADARYPDVESDEVPGGRSYTDPHPEPGSIRDEPEILTYEQQLVREPAPVGEGIPSSGDRDTKPGE